MAGKTDPNGPAGVTLSPELAEELAHLKDVTGMDPDRVQKALAKQVKMMRVDAAAAAAKRLGNKLERMKG
jgi:hypothetical protein